MELDLTDSSSNRGAHRHGAWLEVTLITGFIFSLLVGVGALVALFGSSQRDDLSWTSPAQQTINPEQIVPQLALAQLAGDPAEALTYQSATAGELGTASAIALATTEFTGPQRLSILLRIAENLQVSGQTDAAALHLNLARAVAVTDAALDGRERAAALAQIAGGFLDAGEEEAALDAAVQAMRAAEQTPGLLPAHRSQAYEALRPVANTLDDPSFRQELAELARNPYAEPAGVLYTNKLSALRSEIAFEDETRTAIAERQRAARQLVERIELTNGLDIGPETESLAAALIREDQLRDEFYRRSLSEGLSLEAQYALLHDRRGWIALKLRIARNGFGMALAPAWRESLPSLEHELAAATASMDLVADALANELPDPLDQTLLRIESVLWLAQQAELDLYPGAAVDSLDSRLQALRTELTRLGSALALPVKYQQDATPPGFRILSLR